MCVSVMFEERRMGEVDTYTHTHIHTKREREIEREECIAELQVVCRRVSKYLEAEPKAFRF